MILCIVLCCALNGVMMLCIVLCCALNGVTPDEIVILIHITSYFVHLRGEPNVLVFVQTFEEIQNSQYVRKTQSLLSTTRIIWDKTCHQSSSSQCLVGL
jgi:hypothetical protein